MTCSKTFPKFPVAQLEMQGLHLAHNFLSARMFWEVFQWQIFCWTNLPTPEFFSDFLWAHFTRPQVSIDKTYDHEAMPCHQSAKESESVEDNLSQVLETKSYILSRIKMVSFLKGFRFVVCLWWFVNACPRHMVQQKSSTWLAQPDWAAFAGCQPIRRQVAMASALNHHLLPPSCQEKRRLNMSRYVKTFNPTDYNELALRATPLAEPCCL